MAPPRILLCGDVLGHLNQLFKRVQSVNKSTGPFDALLCVGQFFPDSPDGLQELSDYLEGRSPVPIPTYFTGDYGVGAQQTISSALKVPSNRGFKTDGVEICPSLYWLRGSGKFTLQGLSVAYLSGRQRQGNQTIGVYSEDDVGALQALSEEPGIVDIFLTNEWPSGVSNRSKTSDAPLGASDPSGCDPVVSQLVAEMKPRYHIAGGKGIFFAREPYLNDRAVHVTRFLGLAAVGNKNKQKFIHAISPSPASSMPPSEICLKPPDTTLSPYTTTNERSSTSTAREEGKRPANTDLDSQYWRYDVSQKRQKQGDGNSERLCFKFTSTGSCPVRKTCNFRHDEEARGQYLQNVCFDFLSKGKCERGPDCKYKHSFSEEYDREKPRPRNPNTLRQKCWFCLSSPDVESHLLISVGEIYYCALAKGPLVQDHALLIPIEHFPHTLALPSESDTELGKFKSALNMYSKKMGKAIVFYEWVSQRTTHANLQAIPIPLSRVSDVQRAFKLVSKRLGFEFAVLTPSNDCKEAVKLLRDQFDRNRSFFYVELPDGTVLTRYVEEQETFPVQFGREVIAGMLNMPDKADWRNCKLSNEDEIKMVEAFKKGFEEFDPAQ